MTIRNHDIAALRRLDVAHHLPAQSSYKLQRDMGGSRVITRAEGSTLFDGDGNAILDGMAGLWCVDIGYGRKELAEVAYQQMLELPYYNTFFRTATPPPIELAARLAGLLGGELQHIFFNSSGSESNDTIFRLVRHYWDLKGQPERKIFISRHNAYHGSTVAAASLGGMTYMHAQGDLPIAGIEHVMQPYLFGEGFGEDPDAFAARAANALEERIIAIGPDKVAAFIGEPVQGAGGVIIPAGILAEGRSDLPQTWCPDCVRRGDLRVRPAWPLVRLPAFRFYPRHCVDGQGAILGISTDFGDRGQPFDRRNYARLRRRLHPWLHLFRPSGGERGGTAQHRDHREREARRAGRRRPRAISGGRAAAPRRRILWSARCARSALSARSRSSP